MKNAFGLKLLDKHKILSQIRDSGRDTKVSARNTSTGPQGLVTTEGGDAVTQAV
jgi:hypothetical protein